MSGEDLVMRLIAEQRRRLKATILGSFESTPAYARMTDSERAALKNRVQDAIGVFYDFIRDVVKVSHEDVLRNEHAVEMIAAIHASQQRQERRNPA